MYIQHPIDSVSLENYNTSSEPCKEYEKAPPHGPTDTQDVDGNTDSEVAKKQQGIFIFAT